MTGVPEVQCRYCDRIAVERVIHVGGAASVAVCDEHRSLAVHALGEIDGVQPV